MLPDVGSISRRIRRPSVLLPEPDSPTRPRVSPAWISRQTWSTARTPADAAAGLLPQAASVGKKIFVRSRISITFAYVLDEKLHRVSSTKRRLFGMETLDSSGD